MTGKSIRQSWGPRRSLRSPSFYIFEYGYMMYIRLFPRQNGQNVYAHVGLTKVRLLDVLSEPQILLHNIFPFINIYSEEYANSVYESTRRPLGSLFIV